MAKGADYEREVCNKLSDWWTGKPDSSVFWRTSNSGGRATIRKAKGMATSGHCGDIGAVDDVGLPLVRLITIEAKRGYSSEVFTDVFDYLGTAKPGVFEGFVSQAKQAARTAGSPFWMLIHRRDRREALVYIPWKLYDELIDRGAFEGGAKEVVPFARTIVGVRKKVGKDTVLRSTKIVAMKLDSFLENVPPSVIRELHKVYKPKLRS